MCIRVWITMALLGALATACTGDEPATSAAAPVEPTASPNEPRQLAGAHTGSALFDWWTVPGRAIVLYTACEQRDCEFDTMKIMAADARGEQWEVGQLNAAEFLDVEPDGSAVAVVSPFGRVRSLALGGADPHQTPATSESVPLPAAIPGFTPHRERGTALTDGRYLILGRWDEDEPTESWQQPNDSTERTIEQVRPVRLFLYDPTSELITPISEIPQSHAVSTAVTTSFGPDTVLEVAVLPGEMVVVYTVGFNGAGYDIPNALYMARLPLP